MKLKVNLLVKHSLLHSFLILPTLNSPSDLFSDGNWIDHIFVAFEMCHYDYYQYDLCGHKAIEILEYCNEVLWKAGMTFQLRPCPEENFVNFCEKILNIPSKDIGKCYWKGMSGYCKMCESSFQMPQVTHFRTYNDKSFVDVLREAAPLFSLKLSEPLQCSSPLRSLAMISTANVAVPDALQQALNSNFSTPHSTTPTPGPNLLTRRLQASGHHPYIYTPYVNATVLELLSISDQFPPEEFKEQQEVFFPLTLQMYDLSHGYQGMHMQWRNNGYCQNMPLSSLPHSYLSSHCGMTPNDDALVVEMLKRGIPLQLIWRGMSIQPFYQHGQRLEQEMIKARAVKENSKMDDIQKEILQKWESADGIAPFGSYESRTEFDH
ncbi:hypothetical protein CJF30_00006525 [Rutstroemia sp. NJR-2017a BBW]|nr:hypothetical protein CJF30_00006525 [Rutstroemia sp. NJR-2017a BBW]